MTEKERFKLHIKWFNPAKTNGEATLTDNGQPILCTEKIEDARLLKNLLNELNDENEQLKQQLYYDGDSVCNICKHQYLVETEKYYVAKCEKEHEECSKIDLNYCEDFELVGDGE